MAYHTEFLPQKVKKFTKQTRKVYKIQVIQVKCKKDISYFLRHFGIII
ncbi:hypothetical protein AO373_1911 [Moraxella catarrhalis]|nr:hypothetical protein AO381_1863 [Moraxella catarrhalis]OAV17218.1 hypothetical protein AO373_1911 [Moraxella catarrhalis]